MVKNRIKSRLDVLLKAQRDKGRKKPLTTGVKSNSLFSNTTKAGKTINNTVKRNISNKRTSNGSFISDRIAYTLLLERVAKIYEFSVANSSTEVPAFILSQFPEVAEMVVGKNSPVPLFAPTLWKDREAGETPPAFIQRHYGKWLEKGLTRADILHLDKKLYQALATWISRNGELDFDLPTKREVNDRWVERISEEGRSDSLKEVRRMESTLRRRTSAAPSVK